MDERIDAEISYFSFQSTPVKLITLTSVLYIFVSLKKITAIIVLTVFLTHWVGVYVYFFIKLKTIQTEMRAQLQTLPEDQLTRLTLSQSEFEQAKVDDHEVKVDGKMYDIARLQYFKGRVIVFALQDKAEDDLLSFLDEITKRSMKDKARASTSLIQFTSLTFILPIAHTFSTSHHYLIVPSTTYQFSGYSCDRSVEAPPPKSLHKA